MELRMHIIRIDRHRGKIWHDNGDNVRYVPPTSFQDVQDATPRGTVTPTDRNGRNQPHLQIPWRDRDRSISNLSRCCA